MLNKKNGHSYYSSFVIHKEFTSCENVYRFLINKKMSLKLLTFFSQKCEKLLSYYMY